MEDSQGSLPAGWITEIKTQKTGSKAGTFYKCYIDLLTGRKCYSKEEIFRYLKSRKLNSETSEPKKKRKLDNETSKSKNKRKLDSETSKSKNKRKLDSETSKPKNKRKLDSETSKPKKKRKLNSETSGPKNKNTYTPCPGNVASRNESSPDFLPPGWTKEIKYRNRIHGRFRRDMYYTDPVTGYVFRSKVDVLRYLETGELGRDAKPKKESISNTQSIGDKFSSPVAAKQEKSARRCLFDSDRLNSDGKTTEKIGKSPLGVQGSTGCSKRRQSGRIRAAQLIEKESRELEDRKQPSESLGNGVPLESEDNHQQCPERGVEDKKLSENVMSMESEDKKLQTNGWRPSESEGKKLLENGLLLESVDKNLLENGFLTESQDKLPENGPLLKSAGKKLSKSAAQLKSTKKNLLGKGEFMESKDKKQMDTGPQMESVDKKQRDTGLRMEAKDEKPLDGGLANANKVPPESEEKKLLQNEMEKCEAKSTRANFHKAKCGKVSILPQRASKRLAGLEANSVVFQDPDLACRLAAKQKTGPAPSASGAMEAFQTGKVEAEKPNVIEAEKPISDEAQKLADDNLPQSPLVLPFGDSWPDPCLEFAFKTLTSDIPMDTLEIEGYFQQQLGVAQSQSPGCNSLFEPQVLLTPSNGSLPCFLENELQANGEKERERNAKGKN